MAKWELIELKDLTPNDGIELAPPSGSTAVLPASKQKAPEPFAVRLVGDAVSLENARWVNGKHGDGHHFQPCSYTQLTWCDLCGEFIWGLYQQSLSCSHCRYTCHFRCHPFIQLDCSSHSEAAAEQPDYSEDIETDTNVDDPVDWRKQELSVSEIQQKVKEYNAQINSNLYMVLNRDGSYTGFIKVLFKLSRPVSLPPPRSPSPPASGPEGAVLTRRTSFYLPRDAAKHLHVSSHTQVREVITALLNKFTVVDNPAKFALFERSERHGQVYLKKLGDEECPLQLRLCAGPSEKSLSFVLKENETGEVNWEAFSLPELKNFMRILQKEEEDHVRQIIRRYSLAREKMREALKHFSTPG
ncbi:ras association domain-containing protein 1-like isoform X1 [Astyanax mexicanus]|uniref:Ras association domain-containing protein 1-like isoform X1 n=1 Tax=Astyanax mexicanus TaxID=7994 RepID=A0A8B9HLP3_ASTMX|nr:ras association domain-containing protein 1-like isoform X1 [Astyanax mexicanus]